MATQRYARVWVAGALFCAWMGLGAGVARATITFTQAAAGIPGTYYDSVAWGDYDNDRDLDLLISGGTGGPQDCFTGLYRYNDPYGTFTRIPTAMPGLLGSAVAWGDYDNDGDLDVALSGRDSSETVQGRIYRNDGGAHFVDIGAGLLGVISGAMAWGDYDHDGDLDLLFTGYDPGADSPVSTVYRNEGGGSFVDAGAGLPGVSGSEVAWADYDNDGDLDALLTGHGPDGYPLSALLRNDDGVFTDADAGLMGVSSGAVDWGDYDNDGDLDLLLAGNNATGISAFTGLYRNNGGVFSDVNSSLPHIRVCAVAWGDYDNDGDLDVLLEGRDGASHAMARIYSNEGGDTFTDTGATLVQAGEGSVAFADYDDDGDLDLVVSGRTDDHYLRAYIYRSDGAEANMAPRAPSGLTSTILGGRVRLSWNPATDAETPAAALSYNLRIGTTPGGSEVKSAMASTLTGYRRVVDLGNAQMRTSWTVHVPPGTYYWSVQSVDGAFAGSVFPAPDSWSLSDTPLPEVSQPETPVPAALRVTSPVAPNQAARMSFELSMPGSVALRLHDASGRCVRTLLNSEMPAGSHQLSWDGTDDRGRALAPGVYFCRLQAGALRAEARVIRIE